MFLFFPYRVEAPPLCQPIANWILVLACVFCMGTIDLTPGYPMILDGWSVLGFLGHSLLHGDAWHLIGNMLYLWLFGAAICMRVGNAWYVPVFYALAVVAAVGRLVFDGYPMVGASGAICGLIGMFLVWYPLNNVACAFVLGFAVRTVEIKALWLIGFWFLSDMYSVWAGPGPVAYLAHVFGYLAGFGLATVMWKLGWVRTDLPDPTIFEINAPAWLRS